MKIVDIDPVVYGWCRNHGYSVLDPEAELEFDIWCSEVDSMKEIDVNDDGDYVFVYGYDVAESRWLHEVKMENEILAPIDGKIIDIRVQKGATVESGELLAIIA